MAQPTIQELNAEVERAIAFVNHGFGMTLPTSPIVVNALRAALHGGDYKLVRRDEDD